MTFEEKLGLTKDLPHIERYEIIVSYLGFNNVYKLIPFGISSIIKALKTDEHLNNLPIREWYNATGFTVYIDPNTRKQCVQLKPTVYGHGHYPNLAALCFAKGINSFSLSELVCILKQCAIMWANKSETMST